MGIIMENELYHYGILGMKWGIRRYQNEDGSLNAAGKRHYGYDNSNIGDKKRLKAATDAAHVERKIESLKDTKKLSSRKQAKIDRLTKIHSGLIQNLDSREIEYGKKVVERQAYLKKGMRRLKSSGISVDGRRALYWARRIKYDSSSEGKQFKQLAKELKQARKAANKN